MALAKASLIVLFGLFGVSWQALAASPTFESIDKGFSAKVTPKRLGKQSTAKHSDITRIKEMQPAPGGGEGGGSTPPPPPQRAGAIITSPSNGAIFDNKIAVAFQGVTTSGSVLTWNFGDGTQATGLSAAHAFQSPGTYQVTFTASGPNLLTSQASISITISQGPIINEVSLGSSVVTDGAQGSITWSVTDAASVSISPATQVISMGSGYAVVTPTLGSPSFVLTAVGAHGGLVSSAPVTFSVQPKPVINSFTTSQGSVSPGGQVTLSWNVSTGATVDIEPGIGYMSGKTSVVVNPSQTSTYVLTASNLAGASAGASLIVQVTSAPISIAVNPGSVVLRPGQAFQFNPVISGGDGVEGVNWTADGGTIKASTGAYTAPSTFGSYTVTATSIQDPTRSATAQVTVQPLGALNWTRDIIYLGEKEVAEVDSAGIHFTLDDNLGSPRFTVGPNGSIEAQQKYEPFGELIDSLGRPTLKGFTNHEQTDPSGLIYMKARFYLPMYHRFGSPDPAFDHALEAGQSWNCYSYVQNNPVMATDPTGMYMDMTFGYGSGCVDAPQTPRDGSGAPGDPVGNSSTTLSAPSTTPQPQPAASKSVFERFLDALFDFRGFRADTSGGVTPQQNHALSEMSDDQDSSRDSGAGEMERLAQLQSIDHNQYVFQSQNVAAGTQTVGDVYLALANVPEVEGGGNLLKGFSGGAAVGVTVSDASQGDLGATAEISLKLAKWYLPDSKAVKTLEKGFHAAESMDKGKEAAHELVSGHPLRAISDGWGALKQAWQVVW